MILQLNLKYSNIVQQRVELFNFRNIECQKTFYNLTSETSKLSKCFINDELFSTQAKKWKSTINSFFHKSFKKIRVTNKKKVTELSILFDERSKLKIKLSEKVDDEELDNEIDEIESKIALICAEDNAKQVTDNFKTLSGEHGSVNTNGMWKMKKRIFPKNGPSLPSCKKDSHGNLITDPNELKSLYLDTYNHRLRHRPIKENLEHLMGLKETLWSLRLDLSKLRKSNPWSNDHLNKVLGQLKPNKARDPHSWINELFKEGVIGTDRKSSLLIMVNKIKDSVTFPEFMEWANITSIYKGKGEKTDLKTTGGYLL